MSLVVGLGGYASAATVRAAIAARHSHRPPGAKRRAEPTSRGGWPARPTWSAPASTTCGHTCRANTPLVVTGNPARPAFERMYRQQGARIGEQAPTAKPRTNADSLLPAPMLPASRERRLVVIGGADGARSHQRIHAAGAAALGDRLRGWQIVHQSGEGQLQQTIDRYREAGVDALTVSFIDEMAPVMFASDLVVCRAGGTTLAELALAGVPAVLVPHPRDVEAYQLANAEIVAATGAATVIDETSLEALDEALAEHLRRCWSMNRVAS